MTKRVRPLLIITGVGTRHPDDVEFAAAIELKEEQMLILSRKVGEKLVIDGNITVEVVKIQGNRITLGIEAPSAVKILRGELSQPKTVTQTVEVVVEDGLLVAC